MAERHQQRGCDDVPNLPRLKPTQACFRPRRDRRAGGDGDEHMRARAGGLEGGRGAQHGAGAGRTRHPQSRPFAGGACLAHDPGGRCRHERHGRSAEIPEAATPTVSTCFCATPCKRCRRSAKSACSTPTATGSIRRSPRCRRTATPTAAISSITAIRPILRLRISEPLQSRLTGRPTIMLSRRITNQDGSFGGVLVAAIDTGYFDRFLQDLQARPARRQSRCSAATASCWRTGRRQRLTKDCRVVAAFKAQIDAEACRLLQDPDRRSTDCMKYLGFEHASQYPLVVTVACRRMNCWPAGTTTCATTPWSRRC